MNKQKPIPLGLFPAATLAALTVACGGEAFAAEPVPALTREKAVELFENYCFDCHGDGSHKGEVALDAMLKGNPSPEKQGEWMRAWKIVRHEFMPPAGKDAPTEAERKALTDWMASAMLGVNFAQPDPGRVTLRRLNRMEYEFSVQDLFGTDLAQAQTYSTDVSDPENSFLRIRDRLPPDETAFGFDNIGDFLTLPPALLERYFEIAEYITSRVVVLDGPHSPVQTLSETAFVTAKSAETKIVTQTATFEVTRAGKYRVETQFITGGFQDFGGAYDFAASVGGTTIGSGQIEVGGYHTSKYGAEITLPAGRHTLVLVSDAKKPNSKGELKPLEVRPAATITGPLGPEYVEYPEPHRRIFFKGDPPKGAPERKVYAREILERVATRAYRRPVASETLDRLVAMAMQNPQFERGISLALTAILTSPEFLFRRETQPRPDDPAAIHPLDEYALASRLSYFLWLSLPDEELMRLAAQGQLRKNLKAQVQRMFADPKSARFFEDFPGQWLRTRNVLLTPISTKASGKLSNVRASMKRETDMFFEDIVRNDRDLVTLITADYTFLDKPLADYYGIKDVPATGFHKVTLPPDSHRGGILTQGSFLVATSNPNRTSPVKRGLFVLENLLGLEPPPPPPNIPALDDVNIGDTSKKTGRELLALHRAEKSCAACHAHFDPIGIALEHYDVVGLWRDTEDGLAIDTTEKSITGEKLTGLADVQRLLTRHKEKLYRGITEKLFTYALGRGLEPADAITTDQIVAQMTTSGGKFSTLLAGVVDSPAFQTRRGDAGGGTKASMKSFVPATPPPEKRRPPKKEEDPKVPRPAENVFPPEADANKPATPTPKKP
jgi:mono/diheme cytochrome c family protein